MELQETVVTARARFFTGNGIETLRVLVERDGTVRPWDAVAGHYTTCHALSPRAARRIARLAGVAPTPRRESLRQRLAKVVKGEHPGVGALEGCPEGGWPETQQALRRLSEELPRREARTYSLAAFVDAVYTVDGAGRYRRLSTEMIGVGPKT